MTEQDRSEPPELPPMARVTPKMLEDYLLAVRNGAHAEIGALIGAEVTSARTGAPGDESSEAREDELRAIWHTAEVGLAVPLEPRYLPKREVMFDVSALIDRYPLSREELIEEHEARQAKAEEWIVPEEPEGDDA